MGIPEGVPGLSSLSLELTPARGLCLCLVGIRVFKFSPQLELSRAFLLPVNCRAKSLPSLPYFHCAGKDVEIQDCGLSHLLWGSWLAVQKEGRGAHVAGGALRASLQLQGDFRCPVTNSAASSKGICLQ